jgi:soluble cytochrome b562
MNEIITEALFAIVSIGAAVTGWVFKMVFSSIKQVESNQMDLSKSLSRHQLHSAETFATKTDVQVGFDRLMTKLDKIDEKLDTKKDKE